MCVSKLNLNFQNRILKQYRISSSLFLNTLLMKLIKLSFFSDKGRTRNTLSMQLAPGIFKRITGGLHSVCLSYPHAIENPKVQSNEHGFLSNINVIDIKGHYFSLCKIIFEYPYTFMWTCMHFDSFKRGLFKIWTDVRVLHNSDLLNFYIASLVNMQRDGPTCPKCKEDLLFWTETWFCIIVCPWFYLMFIYLGHVISYLVADLSVCSWTFP